MALTAAIRTLLIGLIASGLTWLATQLALTLDVAAISETVGNVLFVVLGGLVAYVVNKAGSKYPWVNQLLSLWRAKSPAVYIPNSEESVTAIATPPGEKTVVVSTDAAGSESSAPV